MQEQRGGEYAYVGSSRGSPAASSTPQQQLFEVSIDLPPCPGAKLKLLSLTGDKARCTVSSMQLLQQGQGQGGSHASSQALSGVVGSAGDGGTEQGNSTAVGSGGSGAGGAGPDTASHMSQKAELRLLLQHAMRPGRTKHCEAEGHVCMGMVGP